MGWRRRIRRAGRRTNLALLLLCGGAFLTGWLAFAAAAPVPATLTTVAHGLFGLGVVALIPWKRAIIARTARLPLAGWALTLLVLVCLAAGFAQFFVGYHLRLGLSPIQVHVGAALIAVPLFTWHVLRHRRQPLRPSDLTRRMLLRTGASLLAIGATYAATTRLAGWTRGTAGRLDTGSGRLDADAIPATIWLLDRVPEVDPGRHRVQLPRRELPVSELDALGRPVRARLDCTSGWYAEATWTGLPLSELLAAADLASAGSIEVRSLTGYTRLFPADEAPGLWLVTRCEDVPLTPGTGSPVRLVAPRHRGFWWVKWVASVRLSQEPAALQPPFPLQ